VIVTADSGYSKTPLSASRGREQPETQELIQIALQTGLDAGFSSEEIEAITPQFLLKR
jgi:hypothetical protein